ncbi:hypothetical protein Ndes2437B_g03197 [Nannochloris sp. 'desiccata']
MTGSCLSKKRLSRAKTLVVNAASTQDGQKARQALTKLMDSTRCNPIMIRLAWHDSGSYSADAKDQPWPKPGGATASIRFKPELGYGANNGLDVALNLLNPIKDEVPEMSWADLIQLSSAVAIEHAGGPHIPLKLGRLDAQSKEDCTPDGRLPAAAAPFPDRAASPAAHLRAVFYRMGLTDKDIVALSGAHTLGRARPERSGFGKASTKYTANGPGNPGGSSWTVEWLQFDNSYFTDIKEQKDEELLVLPTDAALFEDEGFRPFAEKYAASQEDFFNEYVESHLKLSELGVKWA